MESEITVEEIDFGVMCRACALRFDLSVLRDITPPIRDAFLCCTGIEVDLLSEDMPTHFCGTCWSRADNASQFKLQCQQSDEKLRSLLLAKRGRLVSSTRMHVDGDEMADELGGGASRSSHPPLQSDDKLLSLLPAKRGRLVSSTPMHVDDDEPVDEFGGGSSRLPNLTLLELEIPLTPTVCDDRLDEVLNEDGDASQNSDDASSMTNFLNEILEENVNPNFNEAVKQNQDHIINPDSVLSFLNCEVPDPKCSKNILNESFNLMDNLSVSVNREANAIPELDVNSEIAYDENINTNASIPIKTCENNNNAKFKYCTFDIDKIHEQGIKKQPISYVEEIVKKLSRPLAIVATDYIKLAMPEQVVLKELTDLGYVRCRYCFRPFQDVKDVYSHLVKNHEKDCLNHTNGFDIIKALHQESWINEKLKEKGSARCKICQNQFFSAKTLYLHVKQKHEKESISKMIASHIDNLIKKNHKDYYICDYCGKEYKHRISFCRHITSHRKGNNNCICKDCGRSFKKRSSYLQHMKSHTIRIPTAIQETIALQEIHLQPRFLCNICGKSLSNQWNLKSHIKRHNTSNRLVCDVCNKGFDMPQDLKRHVKTHMKSAHSYKCKNCEKTFSRSDYLTKHLRRKHSGDRVYACMVCGFRFQYERSLKYHLKHMHIIGIKDRLGGQTDRDIVTKKTEMNGTKRVMKNTFFMGHHIYVCTQCGRRYKFEANLKNHLKKVHKIGIMNSEGGGDIINEKTEVETELNEAEQVKEDAVTLDINGKIKPCKLARFQVQS